MEADLQGASITAHNGCGCIRRGELKDLQSIVSIWHEGLGYSYGESVPLGPSPEVYFTHKLKDPDPTVGIWVLEVDNRIVAWQGVQRCYANLFGSWAESSTYVSRSYHGRVARKLIELAIDHASSSGFEYLTAIVRSDNRPVLRLASSFNWPVVGTLPQSDTSVPPLLFLAKPLRRLVEVKSQ